MADLKRVVVTGAAGFSPIGSSWAAIEANLRANVGGIRRMAEWDAYPDLNTRLGGPVPDFELPAHYTRKHLRAMGRVSRLAVRATELALETAGLLGDPAVTDGRMGVAYGSSVGSTGAIIEFGELLISHSMDKLNSTSYLRMMPHTTAANIGMFFHMTGRVIPTSSACTSGSQGIGYAFEAIRYGRIPMMVAGGAEELCVSEAAVFDTLFATSTRNDDPIRTPSPFDRSRDGLVVGEGACTLVLEDLDHARARGATILAEIVGFGSNSDGIHATRPNSETMGRAMQLALDDAGLDAGAVGYVCAHGTATEHGDIAESQATATVLGRKPVASLKGHTGHTLGACGALESWLSIAMMNAGWFAPTLNLVDVDPLCGDLDYITGDGRELQCEYVMNNNFAFGGVNSSLIFRRWPGN